MTQEQRCARPLLNHGKQEGPIRHKIDKMRWLAWKRATNHVYGRGSSGHGALLVHLDGGLMVHPTDGEPSVRNNSFGLT